MGRPLDAVLTVLTAGIATLTLGSGPAAAVDVPIVYLRQEVPAPPVLSNLDPIPEDLGVAGAEVGLAENLTTGSFLGHRYTLEVISVPEEGSLADAARDALSRSRLLVVDAPADGLLAVAHLPEAGGALLLNAAAGDGRLRDADCRANILHTLPSDDMRTDALAQFLVAKRWTEVVMIVGEHRLDLAWADAFRRSAGKFGLSIEAEKTWAFDADMRRNAAQEVPLFTQDFPDHQAVIVADEIHDWGRYVLYNTWEARPVLGSEGARPEAWAPSVEANGAVQLQNRFEEAAGREMEPRDWAAWAAVRAIGEAVTRTGAADPATLRDYMLSDRFTLAGFKGRPLTFRAWNGQLRQPIPIAHDSALVALAPMEGFLHQRTELDTLGLDEPESACTAFGG